MSSGPPPAAPAGAKAMPRHLQPKAIIAELEALLIDKKQEVGHAAMRMGVEASLGANVDSGSSTGGAWNRKGSRTPPGGTGGRCAAGHLLFLQDQRA